MKHLFFILAFIFCTIIATAQEAVTIHVQDSVSEISFAEVFVGDVFFLTDINGDLSIPLKYLPIGEKITLKSLGYENKEVVVDSQFLNKDKVIIRLNETVYDIGDVSVYSNDFDALAFYKKNKKWKKICKQKQSLKITVKQNLIKANGEHINNTDTYEIKYPIPIKTVLSKDSATTVQKVIYLSTSMTEIVPENKKSIKYNGIIDGFKVFKFERKMKGLKEFTTLIYISEDGTTVKDETKFFANPNDTEKSFILTSIYHLNEKYELMPETISASVIHSKIGKERHFEIGF